MAAEDGDGLLLNFAVADTASTGKAAKKRENWRAKSFKKHARADSKSTGTAYKPGRPRQDRRPRAPTQVAAQNSSLKGYSLGTEAPPRVSNAAAATPSASKAAAPAKLLPLTAAAHSSPPTAAADTSAGAAAVPASKPGRPEQRPRQTRHESGLRHRPAPDSNSARIADRIAANADAGARDLANAAEPAVVRPRREPDATAGAGPAAADADEAADIMAAVQLLQRRDAAVQEALPNGHPDEVEEKQKGIVVFSTDSRPMKRRKTNVDRQFERMSAKQMAEAASSAKPPPRAKVARRAGETAAADVATPAAQRAQLFGATDASSFEGLGLASSLADHLEAINFSKPTRIQQSVIPVMLAGRDVLASAPTGSGKTLSYIAPVVHQIQDLLPRVTRQSGTFAVVMAPTRELCIQIYDVLALILRRYHWVVAGTIYGGENRDKEKARLRKGVNIVVATPGRLLDHLQNTKSFNVAPLRWLVLDEADRLLDLGFEQKIADIVHLLDEKATFTRQTALFSATLHSKLGSLATLSLHDPVAVGFSYTKEGRQLVVMGEASEADDSEEGERQFELPKQLKQHFLEVHPKQRLVALVALLHQRASPAGHGCGRVAGGTGGGPDNGDGGGHSDGGGGGGKVVVFLSTCAGVEFHHALLLLPAVRELGICLPGKLFKLHGNLSQAERTTTFLEFSKSGGGVLLCTDVAARGLDFSGVSSIVQYDPPGEASEYVHRVGRTARMGHAGEAVLFLLPSEAGYLQLLGRHAVRLQPLGLDPVLRELQDPDAAMVALMDAVDGDADLRQMASAAFRAFVRAYAAHPASVKDIFHIKKLHLGHVADSFALRDSPAVFGQDTRRPAEKRKFKAARKASGKPAKGIKKRAAYS